MTDIHYEYKSALHRAHARDAVEREEEKRISRGSRAFTEEEYNERLQYYLSRIPYKLLKMRYSSFTRYFGHLKRLGWVEESGKTEPSAFRKITHQHLLECFTASLTPAGRPQRLKYPIPS